MGRDKKNPKPSTRRPSTPWSRPPRRVLRRHEQQLHATLHKRVTVSTDAGPRRGAPDIVPDEYEPYAHLSAFDEVRRRDRPRAGAPPISS